MIRYRLYTGPSYVDQYATKLEAAGYANVCVGTEAVHFDSMNYRDVVVRCLYVTLPTWTLHDISASLTVLRRIPEQVAL